MKKRLTEQQEFEIMKLVLDKFLWLGFALMAFGLFTIFNDTATGFMWMFIGAVLIVLFMVLIVKEYEILK